MKYTNQAPKDFDAQSAKFKRKHGHLECLPENWFVQHKYDGVMARVESGDWPGQVGKVWSRTDEEYLSIPHIAEKIAACFGPGWQVFGEIWKEGQEHRKINGAARRQSPQNGLDFVVFDAVPTECYKEGKYEVPYGDRWAKLASLLQYSRGVKTQGSGEILVASQWRVCDGHLSAGLQDWANTMVAHPLNAYDGLIVRDPKAFWYAGACKEGEAIKVKQVLSFDLKIVDQHAEQRPTKLGGYFTVEYKGVRTDVGSGLTKEMLERIMAEKTYPFPSVSYVGSIAEVECLGITPDGKLREPRLKSIRHDTIREEDKG